MKGYHYIKRGIDIILSGMAIVILSPLLLFLCIAIKLDTPGPILFKQKRVGIHRSFFQIYKFRTMRIDTPKDVPTHMLENPEQYITKVGKFLRKTSLDELPQIFNIFKGEMSIVGPRPALWNQDDLVAEREKYGANDVTPGLTGWAQINGRDELEIPDKARLDGEYVKHLGPWMDLKCFLGTIGSVLMHDGVVEGGTGELNKAEERAHILEGLLIALDNIDEVISIIRSSQNTQEAKSRLMERFSLSDAQSQAIVDMRLRALTGLEREKLENEYKELEAKIAELRAILADENKLLGVIKKEILVISEKYGDDRRTKIGFDDDMSVEDLISDDDTVIAMTNLGYIKRMSVDNFKSQNRGGKGIKGMQTIDEDFIEDLLMTTNHHYIMFFTNMGRCYRIKAYEIPEAGRTARGTAIVNLLQLQTGEKVTAAIPMREIDDDKYLFMATKNGMVKKTPMREYSNMRKTGLQAILLREGDELIEVKVTDNTEDIFLATKFGMSIRFKETDARITGRVSYGVIGMKLDEGDEVVGMQMASQGEYMLVVSEKGYGKRTGISEFKLQLRGGKGLLCYNVTEKTGNLVGMKLLDDGRDIMLITNEGILIRMGVDDISVIGRNTSGVKLMSIDADSNVRVASIAKVRESSRQDEEDENVEDPESEENEDGEITE